MELIVKGLTKKYANTIAVDQLSFEIQPGEIVGFLGPNGAGKSTTLKMIAGILTADEGTIVIDGVSMDPSNKDAKRKVGFLSEANPLYVDLYVKEYLSFIADVHHISSPEKTIKETLDLLQMQEMQSKKIGALSKGYKQRVGIAAAIMHQPSLILLDEPTSGLDPNQLLEIRSIIKMLSQNAMVLFSSHILQEVSAICTRALIINKGLLVADRNMDALLNVDTNHLHVIFEDDISSYQELLSRLPIQLAFIDKHTLVIKSEQNIDTKKLIMQFAIDHSLNIRQLHVEQGSLEEIFKLLTHSKK
jgi:ABC-2 type transport system ATP-binding protein